MGGIVSTPIGLGLAQTIVNSKKKGKPKGKPKIKRPQPPTPGSDRWFKETEAKYPGLTTFGGPTDEQLSRWPSDTPSWAR